ncbi:MAG: DNA polymerase delta subunit one [Monoraphidium minutum]|nr:MAG: DNA polymerase delta subunit one [Monoraphidium minutum]
MSFAGKRNAAGPPGPSPPAAKRGPANESFDDLIDEADDMFNDDDVPEAYMPDDEEGGAPELDLCEAGRNWLRPAAPNLQPGCDALVFQQLEVDYTVGKPRKDVWPTNAQLVPVVRMYGVNDAGNSVCVFVHGFEPYFFCECPPHWVPEHYEELLAALRRHPRLLEGRGKGSLGVPPVTSVEPVQRADLWTFQGGRQKTYLKITVAMPNLVPAAKGALEDGSIRVGGDMGLRVQTFEANVIYALRFMVDTGMGGGSWVELPAGSWKRVAQEQAATYCQIEAHVRWDKIIVHPPEGEWSRIAPLRVLSFDIECAGRKGHFPEPSQDPVIQIASLVTALGDDKPLVRNILTLGTCAPIPGAEVMSFSDERELLRRWTALVLETDPDVIIGYNIINFDLPYIFERARALKVDAETHQWGRLRHSRVRMRDAQFSSKAYGTHDYKELTIEGRVQFDLLMALQRDHKLSSYSLNSVSAHFLGEQKEDVHHSAISDLQAGNEETRRRLAVYCLKDAYLPQRLLDKLMYMYNYVEMARVTGVPMSYLLTRGQSIKVFSQLLRKARQKGFIIPVVKPKSGPGGPGEGVGYEGATVLEPKIGFYKTPIATLDFASLYPSIMMAHNLCYTTLLTPQQASQLPPESYEKTPSGDLFVRRGVAKGILPEILEELLAARKRAKADLKKESDPFKRAVLDGRQLALKVSANSVYGFTGATVGKMPCLAISSATTAYGRQMIEATRAWVQAEFCVSRGRPADCEVIYGDTDSVMVNFKVPDVATAMALGQEAAQLISQKFPPPVKLEFEKVYYPYLLMNKKRYAGLLWTKAEKWDKMDTKGIETVRRDNCGLVRQVVATCLDKILIERDEQAAVAYVKGVISDLLQNRVDMSLLVVTKALAQEAEDYKVKAAHVELAEKMRKRDPATAPTIGDRVPYVIIKAAKGAKAYEKAEDPIYALEHNLPIDCQHYLDHHLAQPLQRIFEPVLKNPKELLSGAHTRSISVATPSSASGGIMRFAKIKLTCLACRAPLTASNSVALGGATNGGSGSGAGAGGGAAGSGSLCVHCAHKEPEVYARSLAAVNALEQQFGVLWTQCQRCQGSLHQDVLCTSRDCPIFYRRKKVQKELSEAHTTLARFNDLW